MRSSAHYLKLVWDAKATQSPFKHPLADQTAFDALYAALEELRQLSPPDARRFMVRMIREHRQASQKASPRRPARARQLDLFTEIEDPHVSGGVLDGRNVIPWRNPYLVEEHS